MASRNGRAIVTPAPFNTVLREICFLKINIGFSLATDLSLSPYLLNSCHLRPRRLGGGGRTLFQESFGTNDTLNNREKREIVFSRVANRCPHLRHVEVLQFTVDRIHHQLLRERLCELRRTARQ